MARNIMTLAESIASKPTFDALMERRVAGLWPDASENVVCDGFRAGLATAAMIGAGGAEDDAALRGETETEVRGFECPFRAWMVPGASVFSWVL